MAIADKSDSDSAVFSRVTSLTCNSSFVRPPWLLSTVAELEKRIKALANRSPKEDNQGCGTFAKRAEAYYQERPQLLSLLQDLYNAYKSLSNRYTQTLAKHNRDCGYDQEEDTGPAQVDSDTESSVSYQPPARVHANSSTLQESDALIAEIVTKNVDYEILLHEAGFMERKSGDSSRKIELQKSLLEVLESERLVLLNENANLMYKVAALMAENKRLAAETEFMKRKAGEMARCALKMREDYRTSMLSSKIEDLQGQIHRLEKRNTEYYEQLVKKDQQLIDETNYGTKSKSWTERGVALEACFLIRKLKSSKNSFINGRSSSYKKDGRKGNGWWERVKNLDMFLCGQNPSSI